MLNALIAKDYVCIGDELKGRGSLLVWYVTTWQMATATREDSCSLLTKNKASYIFSWGARGGAVVEALRYRPEGRGIESRWCHWNFSLT
jgi:hypothetical protein